MAPRYDFKIGDRVIYDPRWKSGRRLYATVTEHCHAGSYNIVARFACRSFDGGVGSVRIGYVRSAQLRPMSAIDLLGEVAGG